MKFNLLRNLLFHIFQGKLLKIARFLFLFIVLGCQENVSIETNLNSDIENAKNWFELNQDQLSTSIHSSAARVSQFKKQPEWSKSKVHTTENGLNVVEVVLDYDTYIVPSDKKLEFVKPNMINSMLLFEVKQEVYKIYLLKIYPDNENTRLTKDDFDRLNYGEVPSDFSGQVMVFDWNENFLGGWEISNGVKTHYLAKTSNSKAQNKSINGRTSTGVSCHLVTTDWYTSVCNDNESYCTDWLLYDTDTFLRCDYIAPQVPQPPDGGGDSGGGSGSGGDSGSSGSGSSGENCLTRDTYIPELMVPCVDAIDTWEDDKIDDSLLKPCMQTILTDLKNITQGSVGKIIQKFSGTVPGYNWELKDGTNPQNAIGETNPPGLYNKTTQTISTTFDSQSWKAATELSWARTILHESVHAYLSVYFATDPANFIKTYPQMIQDWGTLNNWNAVHHEEFARSLVNAIADALQTYGTNKGYSLTRQFYEDMSWAGLQTTSAFQNLPASDQTRILDTIAIELTKMDTQGNIKPQMGKNAGC